MKMMSSTSTTSTSGVTLMSALTLLFARVLLARGPCLRAARAADQGPWRSVPSLGSVPVRSLRQVAAYRAAAMTARPSRAMVSSISPAVSSTSMVSSSTRSMK